VHTPQTIQRKHAINQPDDSLEKEADRIAEEVTGTSPERDEALGATSAATPAIQRAVADEAPAGEGPAIEAAETTAEEASASGALIVEDETGELAPGQMRKTAFLDELRNAVCIAADAELAAAGRSTEGCPYIERWISYYRTRSSRHIERAIHVYAPETEGTAAAGDYIPAVTDRLRRAVAVWVTTGEVTGVPEGTQALPPAEGGGGESSPTAESVQLKSDDGESGRREDPATLRAEMGSGHALGTGVKSRMESAFGHDFSNVRIHTDAKAGELSQRVRARAFTIGSDIAFGSGEYQPGTPIGDALLAHELAHVVQQGASASFAPLQEGSSGYNSLEEDADASAVGAVAALWGGARGKLKEISQTAGPRLKSGLRLSRCPEEEKKSTPSPSQTGKAAQPTVPSSPPGEGWVRNATAAGQTLGAGDMEGTYYIDASVTELAQKLPARGVSAIRQPNFAGAYFTFADKSKGADCGGGTGDRNWLSYKYYEEATVVGARVPGEIGKWSTDISGFSTNGTDFHDFTGLPVPGGLRGYIRRSYRVGIVCACKSDTAKAARGFLTDYSYKLDIWFNDTDVAVRVIPGESYGSTFDWCRIPPSGVTCVDTCPPVATPPTAPSTTPTTAPTTPPSSPTTPPTPPRRTP
jgi:hypothetical protein